MGSILTLGKVRIELNHRASNWSWGWGRKKHTFRGETDHSWCQKWDLLASPCFTGSCDLKREGWKAGDDGHMVTHHTEQQLNCNQPLKIQVSNRIHSWIQLLESWVIGYIRKGKLISKKAKYVIPWLLSSVIGKMKLKENAGFYQSSDFRQSAVGY